MPNILGFLGEDLAASDRARTRAGGQAGGDGDGELLDAYSRAVVDAVDQVAPAVVHVEVAGSREGRRAQGTGSGVVVSPDGLILTNNHVVDGAKTISVAMSDARRFRARVLGR